MITTIIFDWGGVLTVGRYTYAILENISKTHEINIKNIYSEFDKLIVALNESKITKEQFMEGIKLHNIHLNLEQIKDLFKRSIKPNNKTIALLPKLKNYKLLMLSNNDDITVEILKKEHQDMLSNFEKSYFSSEYKIKKPNLNFYKILLHDSNLKPEECIFIDDKEKNIKAAEELGIKGILFKNTEQLIEDLKELGIKIE